MNQPTLRALLLPALLWAPAAFGQLTVVTDHPSYTVGDMVHITIHNAGPSVATFVSYPAFIIWHMETGDCVYGCVGLPVVWDLMVGATEQGVHDTGFGPDQPGHYTVSLSGSSGDPGSILSVTYELTAPVAADAATWGAVKSLFR